jgi:hypothetical protein
LALLKQGGDIVYQHAAKHLQKLFEPRFRRWGERYG